MKKFAIYNGLLICIKIYRIPNLHENSVKARLLIDSPKWSMKPLSKAVTALLKLINKEMEQCNFKTQYYSCVKTFWPIQNNQTVIDTMKKINLRNQVILISTFHFSTRYASIPHHKLKSAIRESINVSMIVIKNSLGSLSMVLFGLTINRNTN